MTDEIYARLSIGTWELVPLPPNKSLVMCWWLFTLKTRSEDTIDDYKAHLVVKGYT